LYHSQNQKQPVNFGLEPSVSPALRVEPERQTHIIDRVHHANPRVNKRLCHEQNHP
jgi:hypothetical protein